MADFLLALGKLNLAMGAAILVVCMLRRPLRLSFGAPIAYAVWFLVPIAGIASLFPPRVTAAVPFAHIVPAHVPATRVSVVGHIAHSALRVTEQLAGQSAPLPSVITAPPPAPAYGMPDAALLLFAAWVLGAMFMALYLTRLQFRFYAAVRAGEAGPAVLGFVRPRIMTPDGFQEHFSVEEQAAILAHEHVHLARQDARINALTALLRCLCWFNPLIHLGARWLRIDQELACDATAVTGNVSRRDYAQALLKSQLVVTSLPLGCNWPGSQHPLIERIALLKRKRPGTSRRLAGASLVMLAATFAGLGAWAAQPPVVRPVATSQPRMVLAALPTITLPDQTAGNTGLGQPAATANPTGSDNDVDASNDAPANEAVSATPAGAPTPRTVSIGARMQSTIAALPRMAAISEPKIIANPNPTDEDALPKPRSTLAQNTAAGPDTTPVPAQASDRTQGFTTLQDPRTELALRHYIESWEKHQPAIDMLFDCLPVPAGTPPSSVFCPERFTQQHQAEFQQVFDALGALKSISFKGVDFYNAYYIAEFANGQQTVAINLTADGRINSLAFIGHSNPNGPEPGTEVALRQFADGLANGHPVYDLLTPEWAKRFEGPHPASDFFQNNLGSLGALRSLTFQNVTLEGFDRYEATYEHGRAFWDVAPVVGGKMVRFKIIAPVPGFPFPATARTFSVGSNVYGWGPNG